MDYLDHLIELNQIEGEIDVLCRFHGAWQIQNPQAESRLGIFHIISKGECCLQLDGECFHLKAGDLIFLPYGAAHNLSAPHRHETEIPIFNIQQDLGAFTLCSHNTLNHDFEMFCGYFRYANLPDKMWLNLPKWHLSSQNQQIIALLGLLNQELAEQLGNKAVINALSRVLFTYLVRDYLAHHQIENGILGALQDKRLKNAVQAMLDSPEKDWDMDNLAACCAMSRSTFIRSFKEKTGISAGKFLTTIRLQKAEQLLKNRELSIQQIALAVGYQSEAHFSKLFKQYKQCLPSELRNK